ncbi:type I secretion system permease/ATPase [Chelativorans salis]|uniref:Type I secretion system permease/ATPase n=1 Tax=Chelativorans salis TaxID=2978478 RepID=A0ABT2LM90_9HYPH|nr:type I secretion system permease/ATPase [Chelativorans sp. EGI FJ00035]MCT7375557.1 type I secretion system permease/ATPase [Chelativorans sp. EGI FJ00035]
MDAVVEAVAQARRSGAGDVKASLAQDSGLQALIAAARSLGKAADAWQVWHIESPTEGIFQEMDILRAVKRLGLRVRAAEIRFERLRFLPLPALLRERDHGQYCVLQAVTDSEVQLLSPTDGRRLRLSHADVRQRFSTRIILVGAGAPAAEEEGKSFDLGWFLPSILKHAASFRMVIAAAFVLQLFALASPKLSELVIDRVLVSRGLQSLEVLAIGMLGIALFNPLMEYLRGLVYAHLASCVNAEFSTKLFRHLVHLPLGFFTKRQVGEIIARVRELDHIRRFLIGSALILLLDLVFVGVFVAFMYSYAVDLASIVLGSFVVYLVFWIIVAPFLRRCMKRELERHADNTAYLTEAITGIETVKCLAIEERFSRDWEDRLASLLRTSFKATMLSEWAGGGISLVHKVTSAILLWFGVHHVLAGDLSVGQLVAFNMLAGHVTMPVLRLAQIWHDVQHTGVSLKRIGDILNEKTETGSVESRTPLHKVRGEIELRNVTFRYSEAAPEAVRRLSLKVAAGEKLGVTGRSGSGKSTITRLIKRLDVPQSGQVLVDGVDLAMADTATLRKNMGIVLQESFLFDGTILENLRLGNPLATTEELVEAARLAGAHEFVINDLPNGYDTQVGERGGLLSGGQRQRIAIARALAAQPPIFIFDEATSALDYDSEAAIIERLPDVLENRTAIIITHRLNAMRLCDRIVVLEHGEIVEEGSHADLLKHGGHYADLWWQQNEDL